MKKQTFHLKNLDKPKKLLIFAADNKKSEHGVPTLKEMSEFFVFSALQEQVMENLSGNN
ncbi:MAG: hypothetical protein IJK46_14160 [Prevotella sp.]|nr:hypothetical protein [Prevotella sp.]